MTETVDLRGRRTAAGAARAALGLMVLGALGTGGCRANDSNSGAGPEEEDLTASGHAQVLPGIDVLLADSLELVRGRRVGLITNRSGVSGAGRSTIDLLHESPGVRLVALFAPEHGIRADAPEGAAIADGRDPTTGLPVFSLYGQTTAPTPEMLAEIDIMVFDIQDIGARYYTYVSTMARAMAAAGATGVPFVVLDRPNPLGAAVQGPVLDPAYSSFVGLYPVPVRHGMTVGELARLFVGEFGIEVDLTVVPVRGWRSGDWFDDTGLPWIPPSLNMPTLESAAHYPGTCLFEGTNISTGRGSEEAFRMLGAPWLDGPAWSDRINALLAELDLGGVVVEPHQFTPRNPSDGKFPGQLLAGIRLTVTDRDAYRPLAVALAALVAARSLGGKDWEWRVAHFDRLAGSAVVRVAVEQVGSSVRSTGDSAAALREVLESWEAPLADFLRLRAPYLLYSRQAAPGNTGG